MKWNFILLIGLFLYSCQSPSAEDAAVIENDMASDTSISTYNEEKAKAYGADDYGMKKMVIAFLKRGPNRDLDSLRSAQLQSAHMENIGKLAEEGKLLVAGPFFGDSDLRGIYIFDVSSIEEAKKLTNTDPAIQAGSLVMELHEWYGSAAMMAIPEIHKEVQKVDF
jgi:uncharacterized protein YciI